jgi:hypothetical protein
MSHEYKFLIYGLLKTAVPKIKSIIKLSFLNSFKIRTELPRIIFWIATAL